MASLGKRNLLLLPLTFKLFFYARTCMTIRRPTQSSLFLKTFFFLNKLINETDGSCLNQQNIGY